MIGRRVWHRNLIKRFTRMFRCDTARIISFPERTFLAIGSNRNTKDGPGIAAFLGEKNWSRGKVADLVKLSGNLDPKVLHLLRKERGF